jgi:hypothetical protein
MTEEMLGNLGEMVSVPDYNIALNNFILVIN